MKTQGKTIVLGGLFLSLLLSGCGSEQKINPASAPAPISTTATQPPPSVAAVTEKPSVPDTTQTPTIIYGIGSTRTAEKDGMILMFVPAGEFKMGSDGENNGENPLHTVNLDAYWIDRTDVTNAQFAKFINESGYKTDAEKGGNSVVFNVNTKKLEVVKGANWMHPEGATSSLNGLEKYPVTQMSWNDAAAYCQWAGRRLPTEAEWEKAARGTDGRKYPWGNQPPAGNLLNFADKNLPADQSDNKIDDGYRFTSPVGNFPDGASPYGVMDMAGNVWNWVVDWFDGGYYKLSPALNPQGPVTGSVKVLRGGGWGDNVNGTLADNRVSSHPNGRGPSLGFRCASSTVSPKVTPVTD
ncbi:MAG TPA: formylglycine-generating enzyme family protein [Leptolinea sp.]